MRKSTKKSRPFAKKLRAAMTEAEVILWSKLKIGVFPDMRFRRQHPIGRYIADFACDSAKLVVEVDGATHSTDAELNSDRRRTEYFVNAGWRVLRVQNEDVYERLGDVIETITRHRHPLRHSSLRSE